MIVEEVLPCTNSEALTSRAIDLEIFYPCFAHKNSFCATVYLIVNISAFWDVKAPVQ
jgi:hypothetical protein